MALPHRSLGLRLGGVGAEQLDVPRQGVAEFVVEVRNSANEGEDHRRCWKVRHANAIDAGAKH